MTITPSSLDVADTNEDHAPVDAAREERPTAEAFWSTDGPEDLSLLSDLVEAWRGGVLEGGGVLATALDTGYTEADIGRAGAWAGIPLSDLMDCASRKYSKGALATGYQQAGPPPTYVPWRTLPLLGRRPQIITTPDAKTMAENAWQLLRRFNEGDAPFLYAFGGRLVWVDQGDGGEAPVVLNVDRMKHVLGELIMFMTHRHGDLVPARVPGDLPGYLLANPSPPVPTLTAISSTPVLAPSGRLHDTRGYDDETRVLYLPRKGPAMSSVSTQPPPAEVQRAVELLTDVFTDFPFEHEADRTTAIAAVLLPFLRPAIDGPTPLHLVHKPSPGTGATLLVNIISMITTGRLTAPITEASDDDEWRKRLTAYLMEAPVLVLIDNINRRLDSAALAASLTTDTWKDRLLGVSQMVSAPVKCLWIATGNNPTLSHEMSRRTVPIRLDANIERPWLRDGFKHEDLLRHVRQHRNDLVWAALTIIRAWVAAGRPKGAKRLGMYEDWSEVLGGVLAVAGLPGFLTNLDSLYEAADAETQEWDAFLTAWHDRFSDRAVKVKELFELADETLDLGAGSDHSRKTALGKALQARRGRIIGGKQIVDVGLHQGAIRWRVGVVDGEGHEDACIDDENQNGDGWGS